MVDAANRFLNALDAGQKAKASFAFDSEERFTWFYTPVPRKGLTLIWPADWTHLHRGVVSPSEEKYIITGWFDFL